MNVTITTDIDVYDILHQLNDQEKQELIDDLYQEDHEPSLMEELNYNGVQGEKLQEALAKIQKNRSQLSNEDEEMIINLAEKLV